MRMQRLSTQSFFLMFFCTRVCSIFSTLSTKIWMICCVSFQPLELDVQFFKQWSLHVPTLDSNLLIVRSHASVVLLKAYSLRPYRFLKVGVWWHNLNVLSRHINTPFTNLPPAEWVLWWTTPRGAKSDGSHRSDLTVNFRVCSKANFAFSDFLCVIQPCTKKPTKPYQTSQTHRHTKWTVMLAYSKHEIVRNRR